MCLSVGNRKNPIVNVLARAAKTLLTLGAPDSVRWCTGQCPVRQAGSSELAALGNSPATYGYNSPDCPVCTELSGEPTVGRANGRLRDLRKTRGRANGREGPPDCPVCTGQCPVHQRLPGANSRFRQRRKEIRTGQCPVVHRIVSGESATAKSSLSGSD